jgi:hypothetical protein
MVKSIAARLHDQSMLARIRIGIAMATSRQMPASRKAARRIGARRGLEDGGRKTVEGCSPGIGKRRLSI